MASAAKKLFCMSTQHYDTHSRKVGKIFVGILCVELDEVHARKWNAERVIVFNMLSSNAHKALTILSKFVIWSLHPQRMGVVEAHQRPLRCLPGVIAKGKARY